jgi:Phospholipase_D-nuclease N-terminal
MIAMLVGGGGIFLVLGICFSFMLAVLSFVFWIWMLIDSVSNQKLIGNEKVIWVLVIALTHWLGALIYFLVARNQPPEVLSS